MTRRARCARPSGRPRSSWPSSTAPGPVGLVAFGHEALALTRPGAPKADVARTLASLDARRARAEPRSTTPSACRSRACERMSNGARILVLLTDGRDVGSSSSLCARRSPPRSSANVIVYSIAAGRRADKTAAGRARARRRAAGSSTPPTPTSLGATYRALGRELDRTWQLSLPRRAARPGDQVDADRRAAGASHGDARCGSRSQAAAASSTSSRLTRSRSSPVTARGRRAAGGAAARRRRAPPGTAGAAPPRSAACSSRTSHAATSTSREAGPVRALRPAARLDRALARRPSRRRRASPGRSSARA